MCTVVLLEREVTKTDVLASLNGLPVRGKNGLQFVFHLNPDQIEQHERLEGHVVSREKVYDAILHLNVQTLVIND